MPQLTPFFREAGSGQDVVYLHSNASASAQWRPLMERLSHRFRLFAPDTFDAGKSPGEANEASANFVERG